MDGFLSAANAAVVSAFSKGKNLLFCRANYLFISVTSLAYERASQEKRLTENHRDPSRPCSRGPKHWRPAQRQYQLKYCRSTVARTASGRDIYP